MSIAEDWVRYKIYCNTENDWVEWTLDASAPKPTTCSNDSAHDVNAQSVDQIGRRGINEVVTQEEYIKTGGHFETYTVTVIADCNATTHHEVSAFVNMSALSIHYTTTSMHQGDMVSLSVAENTLLGATTGAVTVGDKTISVTPDSQSPPSAIFANAYQGPCHALLFDGANYHNLGRIKSLNSAANTVEVELGSPVTLPAGVGFAVTFRSIREVELGPASAQIIGNTKIGGSHVPGDTTISIDYVNRSLPWPVGQITSDVANTDTVVAVDDQVLSELELEDKVQLNDHSTSSAIGQVTQIDKFNKTITVSIGSTGAFAAATPTYVLKASKKFVARAEELQ